MGSNQDEQTCEKDSKAKEIVGIRRGITRPPLNFLAILNKYGTNLDTSSPEKLTQQLYAGVFLTPYTLKYFVDEKSNKNCFVLFAREFNVTHGNNPQCWRWIKDKETSGEDIEVAELLEVWWLDVNGKIRTIDLSPGTLYEIVFIVKKMPGYADNESNFSLNLIINFQYSKSLSRSESLEGKPLENWFEIQVGEFVMLPQYVGDMVFFLQQHHGDCKRGLIVKCAIVRPKK